MKKIILGDTNLHAPIAPDVDTYGTVRSSWKTAQFIRQCLDAGRTIAIPLGIDDITLYHISFVPLGNCIPLNVVYSDGSNGGVQINIDRLASYALPWNASLMEESYIVEKWHVSKFDALELLKLFRSILKGKDCYGDQTQ